MTDPAELVYRVFSGVVMGVVAILLVGSLQGWNISSITETVSSYAVPFTVSLVVLFFILTISQEL